MELSLPSHFLAVFSKGTTWALLGTPYGSRLLRKRIVMAYGCRDVLTGSWWTQVWTSSGWKMLWSSASCSDVSWNCKRRDPAVLSSVRKNSYTSRDGNLTVTFRNR